MRQHLELVLAFAACAFVAAARGDELRFVIKPPAPVFTIKPAQPPPAPSAPPAPVAAKPAEDPLRRSQPVAGDHSHTCPRCRHTWWHSGKDGDYVRSHTCPKCGTFQAVVSGYAPVAAPTPDCPDGN